MQEDKTLRIAGTVFIDATYEGDLAAMAGAPFKVGREAKSEYGEPHGLEEADKLLQAYCFRLTVTDNLDNRVSIRKPAGYDPHEFELLAKYVNAKKIKRFAPDCLFAREKTQGKSDGNAQWHCWVSTDWASFHHDYPEGSWDHRQEIYDEYKRRTLSWFYFLQHDPSVPEVLRQDALRGDCLRMNTRTPTTCRSCSIFVKHDASWATTCLRSWTRRRTPSSLTASDAVAIR